LLQNRPDLNSELTSELADLLESSLTGASHFATEGQVKYVSTGGVEHPFVYVGGDVPAGAIGDKTWKSRPPCHRVRDWDRRRWKLLLGGVRVLNVPWSLECRRSVSGWSALPACPFEHRACQKAADVLLCHDGIKSKGAPTCKASHAER
jgi:hypothetical protein